MNTYYDILKDFLRCNKNINLKFKDSNLLEVFCFSKVILSLQLDNDNLEKNAKYIYKNIINLDGITMYIPKIYIKD